MWHTFSLRPVLSSRGDVAIKKICEELDRVGMPMPTVEETDGGVLAVMKRFTMDEVIARRKDDITEPCREHVGNLSET